MLWFCYHASRFCDFAVHNFNIPVSILSLLTAHILLQFLFDALWEVRLFPVTVSNYDASRFCYLVGHNFKIRVRFSLQTIRGKTFKWFPTVSRFIFVIFVSVDLLAVGCQFCFHQKVTSQLC